MVCPNGSGDMKYFYIVVGNVFVVCLGALVITLKSTSPAVICIVDVYVFIEDIL